MASQGNPQEQVRWRQALWRGAKQAGFFLLFSTILMIPRLRRLRRRVGVWTAIRVLAVLAACCCIWWYSRLGGRAGWLALGLVLLAFGCLVRAKLERESADASARRLNALVVLNGGTFFPPGNGTPAPGARIFVNPETLYVHGNQSQSLAEIPLARVRSMESAPVPSAGSEKTPPRIWEVRLSWEADEPLDVTFRFEGFFAEHLAGVAESTLRKLLKKELPVLKG